MDAHGNVIAQEGCDRCDCGCKYWEHDRCIDCGTHVSMTSAKLPERQRNSSMLIDWDFEPGDPIDVFANNEKGSVIWFRFEGVDWDAEFRELLS